MSIVETRCGAQLDGMSRRRFLKCVAGSALVVGCGAAVNRAAGPAITAAPTPRRIQAIAFDLFTIFDPRGVDRRVEALIGKEVALATTWKTRLFEYCWIRAASGRYVDFEQLVRDSLAHAARMHGIAISGAVRTELEASFTQLEPWPDAARALYRLRASGLRLATLANFAPQMIRDLLAHSGLRDVFDVLISTDEARTYKPDPRAYALAETKLRLRRSQIAFAAFGGWDAAGAHWYGYPTCWVNRLGVPAEVLAEPDATAADLNELASWVSID
jgi:2-haloacid dehalogenase